MRDRELLELAAKAAGIEEVTPTMLEYGKWNPLDDDGDALRLAISLNRYQPYNSRGGFRLSPGLSVEEQRRAIVRAAAEIGMAYNKSATA